MGLLPEYDEDSGRIHYSSGISMGPQPGRIEVSSLVPGDVLVWYATGGDENDVKTHTAIRELTEGAYSHVGIYAGNGQSIDAGPDGVHKADIAELIASFELGRVLRYNGLDDERRAIIVKKANSFIKYPYAKLDAVCMPIRREASRAMSWRKKCRGRVEILGYFLILLRRFITSPRKKVFCSEMVLESYGAADIFTKNDVRSAALSPNDFIENGYFEYVGFLSQKDVPETHPFDLLSNSPVQQPGYWKKKTLCELLHYVITRW
ncbi:C40 family peptidase [Pseudomonas yamanorum]